VAGIGSRVVSSAHQQSPARLQVNSVPHREQASRRATGISNRFVMIGTGPWPCFSSLVHAERRYHPRTDYTRKAQQEQRRQRGGDADEGSDGVSFAYLRGVRYG